MEPLENVQTKNELKRSMLDSRTGIPGSDYSDILMNQAIEQSQVVFMIDIDNFKAINEVYGYSNADTVLKQLGSMLREHFHDREYARKGGEEFIVIVDDHDLPRCKAFVETVGRSLKINGEPVTISAGMGKSVAVDENIRKQLPLSEYCLKLAKSNGKNQLAYSDGRSIDYFKGIQVSDRDKMYVGEFSLKEGCERLKAVNHIFDAKEHIIPANKIAVLEGAIQILEEAKINITRQKGGHHVTAPQSESDRSSRGPGAEGKVFGGCPPDDQRGTGSGERIPVPSSGGRNPDARSTGSAAEELVEQFRRLPRESRENVLRELFRIRNEGHENISPSEVGQIISHSNPQKGINQGRDLER
jgi:diguanylate cyclase (GGDEF)-like protein